MRPRIAGLTASILIGALALGRAEAADPAFGTLPCIKDQHRTALVSDVILWQVDILAGACIDKFNRREARDGKKTFNQRVDPFGKKIYATMINEVFYPLYGDDAQKARLQFLATLTGKRNKNYIERITEADCTDIAKQVDTIASEARSRDLGPTFDRMVTAGIADSFKDVPRCGS